jgi:acyl-lipid omega-6 desaturase (Delta-12 desaturase)
VRSEKELLLATRVFATDDRLRSWWCLFSTIAVYLACLTVCCLDIPFVLRIAASCLSGLVIVRMFIIYHDYQHHAILTHSRIAEGIMQLYGMLVLSPTSVWNRSHDHHHKHNCKDDGEHIGSYPVMTCREFTNASRWQQWCYRASRHPLTIATGYLTVFMGGMCLRAAWNSPVRHADSVVALLLHAALCAGLAMLGWDSLILCLILPLTIACGVGSYLFYAQHNFPGCMLDGREKWSHVRAAIHSSSYMRMSGLMHWFTGNIGYHHVHHLNAKIPFYKLPVAMASLVELQKPSSTSLDPADIWACFRLNLWDCRQERFVSFREARASQ